jgi:hypothetical protein
MTLGLDVLSDFKDQFSVKLSNGGEESLLVVRNRLAVTMTD